MNYHLVNCRNLLVPFYDCNTDSGIDRAIRSKFTLNQIIKERGLYEDLIKVSDVCYDVGAFVGTHSILFSLLGGIVYSFEPASLNYSRLIMNCDPFRSIKTFDIAFHEKEYNILTKFKDCNTAGHNMDKEQFIKYRIFDKFIAENKIPAPDFLKIDIEGMETILLKTLKSILGNNKTKIYIELHPKSRETMNINSYSDNPNWLFTDEGGYDFNELKEYNYKYYKSISDCLFVEFNRDIDFNTLEGAIVLIPK